MFKLFQFFIKIIFLLLFMVCSPLIFIISIIYANSMKDAFEDTLEIIFLPFQNIN